MAEEEQNTRKSTNASKNKRVFHFPLPFCCFFDGSAGKKRGRKNKETGTVSRNRAANNTEKNGEENRLAWNQLWIVASKTKENKKETRFRSSYGPHTFDPHTTSVGKSKTVRGGRETNKRTDDKSKYLRSEFDKHRLTPYCNVSEACAGWLWLCWQWLWQLKLNVTRLAKAPQIASGLLATKVVLLLCNMFVFVCPASTCKRGETWPDARNGPSRLPMVGCETGWDTNIRKQRLVVEFNRVSCF